MKRVPFLTVLLALLLSACAPKATPTTDPALIQASAVAAANTMVALTQAAVPTETPVPPTPLPSPTALPSPTLLALPTLAVATLSTQAVQPTSSGSSGGGSSSGGSDPCNAPMPAKFAGPQIPVTIKNAAGASIVLSVWLSVKNDFGECGYRGFNLDKGGVLTTTLPVGCYGAGAFINDPKKPSKSFGSGCMKGTNTGHITVGTDVIQIEQ
jgi:hypothetical protein